MKRLMFIFLLLLLFPLGVFAEEDIIPNASSGILMEVSSGKILFEKEKDMEVSIASMTKMVAQILILEAIEDGKIKWNDVVTVSKNASDMGGSQIYLEEGEKITVEDLMKGISVASGNDATVAMAEYLSGSEEKFVKKMNDKVKELGLKHTHFSNSTGLDEKDHYSSSYDMAVIARELVLNHPDILRFSSIYEDYLREDTDRKFWLVNTNKLIRQYDGVDGLKTGHTDAAGYCLAATAKRNDVRLIAIVLGEKESKVRNAETTSLLDYGFNNVKVKVLKKKGEVIDKVLLSKANSKEINAILEDNLIVVEDIEENNKSYSYDVKMNDISLPIKKGSVIGKINVKSKGKVISTGKLVASKNVESLKFFDLYFKNLIYMFSGSF